MSEICKMCMHTDIKIKQYPCNECDDAFSMFKSGIEQQLQKAHRAAEESAKDAHRRGWEQAKREAVDAAYSAVDAIAWGWDGDCNVGQKVENAIAAMGYKGEAND